VPDALTLVACGAPLAARAHDVVAALTAVGWAITVVGTSASRSWLDEAAASRAAGRPPVFDHRDPGEPKRGPRPDFIVACPLTLNSGSKLALGIMDSFAGGVLGEGLASSTPLLAVPMVSDRIWRHPAWPGHLRFLREAGVRFLDPGTGAPDAAPVRSGTGDEIVAGFDPEWIVNAVGRPAPLCG